LQANDEILVVLLLRFGSDPNEADPDGNTALHWCLRLGKSLLNGRWAVI
jgi:ankyrin repeat protein